MEYWHQILTFPSLVIGPVVLAAAVSGIAGLWTSRKIRTATSGDVDRKIASERELTDAKLQHEKDKIITDRAWIDYGLRRDIYLDLAAQIRVLFESSSAPHINPTILPKAEAEKQAARKAFFETCSKVRIVGNDDVVSELNNFTASIKAGASHQITAQNYSKLMNAIRQDIRTLNTQPPVGTKLDESAFPIES